MRTIDPENLYCRSESDKWLVGGYPIKFGIPSPVVDLDPTSGAEIKYMEEFLPGSIMLPAEGLVLTDDHKQTIGTLTRSQVDEIGWYIEGEIEKTPENKNLHDDLLAKKTRNFSIGFSEPLETIEDTARNVVQRAKALVREVAITPKPQHPTATIEFVRSEQKGKTTMSETQTDTPTNTEPPKDILTRSQFEDTIRDLNGKILLLEETKTRSTPSVDYRSPGEIVKALAKGDEKTVSRYEEILKRSYAEKSALGEQIRTRAFPDEGSTAESVLRDAWIGDLTRLVQQPQILGNVFSTGSLPTEGNFVEYGKLTEDGSNVTAQAAEGDNLAYGYVKVEPDTEAVVTYGGYTRLSRQAIERSSIGFLDTNLRAMANAAGQRMNIALRTAFTTLYQAQVTAGKKVTISDETDWKSVTDALVDGVDLMLDAGVTATALVVDKGSFKALKNLEDAADRPVMLLDGNGFNNVGAINLAGLSGRLAGIQVVCDPNLVYDPTGTVNATAALVNSEALRVRSSGITKLTDQNIVNLSNDFSVYFYAAIVPEIPGGIIPVEITL